MKTEPIPNRCVVRIQISLAPTIWKHARTEFESPYAALSNAQFRVATFVQNTQGPKNPSLASENLKRHWLRDLQARNHWYSNLPPK